MKKILVLMAVMLSGCGPDATLPMNTETQIKTDSSVSVDRIAVFSDNLAYNGKRGIYIIKDKVNGKQFIGISGIGISETGTHFVGKAIEHDER